MVCPPPPKADAPPVPPNAPKPVEGFAPKADVDAPPPNPPEDIAAMKENRSREFDQFDKYIQVCVRRWQLTKARCRSIGCWGTKHWIRRLLLLLLLTLSKGCRAKPYEAIYQIVSINDSCQARTSTAPERAWLSKYTARLLRWLLLLLLLLLVIVLTPCRPEHCSPERVTNVFYTEQREKKIIELSARRRTRRRRV